MIRSETEAREFVARRCSEQDLGKLADYVELLRTESARQNLVSRGSLEEVWTRHIADSAQLLDHVPGEKMQWMDLGSGAGLPGLVIAIMQPQLDVMLVESRRKRFEWLKHLREALDLKNCEIIGQALEAMEAEKAGVISARAFAPLPKLLGLAQRFADEQTLWLLPKGKSAAEELAQLPAEAQKGFHVEQSVTHDGAGIIVGRLRTLERQA